MYIISKTKCDITWGQIKEAAENGTVTELVKSGDQIPVTLKNGELVLFDATYDKKGKLYFVAHNCIGECMPMNSEGGNRGGWKDCEMREYLHSEILPLLPDELQAVIAPTTIVQVLDGERVECQDKLFLLSETQIFGETHYADANGEPEDTQLDIFQNERDRVKEEDGEGTYWWWERSPNISSSYIFCFVSSSGNANYNSADNSSGVAPGFCVQTEHKDKSKEELEKELFTLRTKLNDLAGNVTRVMGTLSQILPNEN
ncbi:MAG: DUF6273 domain-containing protein [Lachnospiraceae bacterium]|nr:DUF6273 domain-containing protein [Lachnospiraceae bacterium]